MQAGTDGMANVFSPFCTSLVVYELQSWPHVLKRSLGFSVILTHVPTEMLCVSYAKHEAITACLLRMVLIRTGHDRIQI